MCPMDRTIDCQRQKIDRRSHGLRTFLHSFTKNRRHHIRRGICLESSHYVDRHHAPLLFALTVAIMGLSCTDALFTLMLLQQGAQELNPVMNRLIEIDIQLFVGTKLLITAICLIFILAHQNFWLIKGVVRTYHTLPCLFVAYCVLITHQLRMLSNTPFIL